MSTEIAPREPELEVLRLRGHTPEQFQTALLALAMNAGNCKRTAKELEQAGETISHETLRQWTLQYPGHYRRAEDIYRKEMEPRTIARLQDIAAQASDTTLLAIEKTREQLEAGDHKDPAGTARNLATVLGITTDKLFAFQGRPTQVVQHDVQGDIRILQKLGVVDIPDADVVEAP